MVIILESPHNDEFDINGNPIGPAIGRTGEKLSKLLEYKIRQFQKDNKTKLKDGIYKVILVNAIQYKTSLGYNTKMFRDRVWINTWIDGGREDLLKRLQKCSPDIILNLCTLGNHSKDSLFQSNVKVDREHIRLGFLNTSTSSLVQDKKGNLLYNNEIIFDSKHSILDKKNGSQLNTQCYPLNGFVKTVIDKFYKSGDNEFLMVYGVHPSSGAFKNTNFVEL